MRGERVKIVKKVLLSAAVLSIASVSPLWAQFTTIPLWNGTSFINSFGVPNTQTYGQSLTLPVATVVTGFSFEIGNCSAVSTFRGHIYAWNGTQATGPSLFNSADQVVAAGSTFNLVTFATGNLSLPAGSYVLFASTSESAQTNSACRWGSLTTNTAIPTGNFVFLNNGTDTAQWTGNAWSTIGQDLAFSIAFQGGAAGVPTLSEWAMILLACGLAGVAFIKLRSQGQPVAPTGPDLS